MIRRAYIQNQILRIFHGMNNISFPINLDDVASLMPTSCRLLSYQTAAKISGCKVDAIYSMCGSSSGATHYHPQTGRCLILYNESQPDGRVLWTQAHELGHVVLEHLCMVNSHPTKDRWQYQLFEDEADFFAWNLLAPLPIMREYGIQNAKQVQKRFGLSKQAADLHFARYVRWERRHIKTAWENDLVRIFRQKQIKVGAS